MSFDYILFDLDGTLTDPYDGISRSVIYALDSLGIPTPPYEILKEYIGPPLAYSFENFAGLHGDDIESAIRLFRSRYEKLGCFENSVIDGVEPMLKKLKESDKKIILCTSKLEIIALRILEKFGLIKYFDFVGGATHDNVRSDKLSVLNYCLSEMNVSDKSKAVLIGDRLYDINAAKEAGITSIGVLCGYGDRAELENAGADFIVEMPGDIPTLIGA